jgi:hypothetical protein
MPSLHWGIWLAAARTGHPVRHPSRGDGMATGTVRRFNTEKGYGFIRQDDGGPGPVRALHLDPDHRFQGAG